MSIAHGSENADINFVIVVRIIELENHKYPAVSAVSGMSLHFSDSVWVDKRWKMKSCIIRISAAD